MDSFDMNTDRSKVLRLEAENARLREENKAFESDVETIAAHNIELQEQLAAAQAVIEQMREALERCTKFTQEDYDALALQPCPEVLNKVRAEAAMATIEWVWSKGSVIPREAYSYVKRIEQGEA